MPLAALLRLGMPLALAIGGFLAWRTSKRERHDESSKPAWRDDSLDDWRRERDETAARERAAREANPGLREGSERNEETKEQNQRIGG